MVGLYGGAASFPIIDFVHGLRTVQGSLTGSLEQLRDLIELASVKLVSLHKSEYVEKSYSLKISNFWVLSIISANKF